MEKTHLTCEWDEGSSQEVKTCSCQMEWFIKLLSLSKDMEMPVQAHCSAKENNLDLRCLNL